MDFKLISLFFLLVLSCLSCTEKPIDIPDFVPPDSERVVLLEELTGVRCPNCPSGAAKVAELLQLYEGQVVAMAIHGEFDATPLNESKYDFRSDQARELEQYLYPFWGKPAAAINRVVNTNGELGIIGIDTWAGYIEAELQKPHQLDLFLETDFDENTRELNIRVNSFPLADIQGTLHLSVAITESHIIDAQLNQTTVIPDYEHNHVFRIMLTDVKGNLLSNGLTKNELITSNYNFTLPDDAELWVPENCRVVAFVTKIEGDRKEVLQAVQEKVMD